MIYAAHWAAGVALLLLAVSAAPALAADARPAGRYAFVPVERGALRLDTGTGAVALCTGLAAASCAPLPETEREVAGRVAAAERRLAALEAAERRRVAAPTQAAALDHVAAVADAMMQRLVATVRAVKRGMRTEAL